MPEHPSTDRARGVSLAPGFSLIETLVATSLLAIAAGGLAHLATLAASTNQHARSATVAALLASSKTEELLAVPWEAQRALATHSDQSLDANIAGLYDLLDRGGAPTGDQAPPDGAYLRRWSVRRVADEESQLVIHVVVAGAATRPGARRILSRLLTIRGRRDWWEATP